MQRHTDAKFSSVPRTNVILCSSVCACVNVTNGTNNCTINKSNTSGAIERTLFIRFLPILSCISDHFGYVQP